MNKKYLIFSTIALFIFAMIWNGVVHTVILKEANLQVASLMRPDMADKMWLSIILTLAIGLLFSLNYLKWCRKYTQSETLGFSVFFTLFMGAVVNLNQYIVYPIPLNLTLTWFAFGIAEFSIYGQIARFVYIRTQR